MPNIYCPSCGTGVKFMYTKPDTCPSCTHSFSAPKVSVSRKYLKEVEEDEEEEPRPKLKKLKQLRVEVDKPQFEKFGEVVGSNPGEARQSRKGISKDQFRERVFKAGSTSIDDA